MKKTITSTATFTIDHTRPWLGNQVVLMKHLRWIGWECIFPGKPYLLEEGKTAKSFKILYPTHLVRVAPPFEIEVFLLLE